MKAGSWRRRLAGQSLILLIALLPALVAGAGIDKDPAAGEWERLAAAASGPRPLATSLVADGFLLATIQHQDQVPSAGSAAAATLLAQARLAQVLGIGGVSFLAYFAIVLAGGRVRALLTLIWLAALPPVASAGYVLRPETASVLFGLLALLLLQCVWVVQRPASTVRLRGAVTVALCATAAVAIGCATATLPSSAGILLLLPGGASVLATGQICLRLLRTLRQRGFAALPMRAAAERLWPWVLAALGSLVATALLLSAAVHAPAALLPTLSTSSLLPQSPLLRWPMLLLAGLGSVHLLLRCGQRLGRRGRLGSDLLLLVYCAVLLLQRAVRADGEDALPAAVPMAVLLADGVGYAVLLLARRRR